MGSFEVFDLDGSGDIDMQELQATMQSLGFNPDEKQVQAMMQQVDKDQNGTIDKEEYCKMMAPTILNINGRSPKECDMQKAALGAQALDEDKEEGKETADAREQNEAKDDNEKDKDESM